MPYKALDHDRPSERQLIRFDRYQVDLDAGELRKEGRKVRLQAQPFQLLVLLLRNSGKLVSREDVKRELWPGDTFVDFDHGLAAAVNKLRQAFVRFRRKAEVCRDAPTPRLSLHRKARARTTDRNSFEAPGNIGAGTESPSHRGRRPLACRPKEANSS